MHMSHEEYHEAAREAQHKYLAARKDDGLLGELKEYSCVLSPGDSVGIQRIGPEKGKSTYVAVGMSNHGNTMLVALSPKEARRFAAGLLDAIEECDPQRPIIFVPVPEVEDDNGNLD